MDRRFTAAGGLGNLLSLYEQVRRELERVSFQELDRMTGEIKNVIEALLTIDYELRKAQNLTLVFDSWGGIGAPSRPRLLAPAWAPPPDASHARRAPVDG